MSTCLTCGIEVGASDWACLNGHDRIVAARPAERLGGAGVLPVTDHDPVAPGLGTARGQPASTGASPCPAGCGQMVLPAWDRCSLCGTLLETAAVLTLLGPWGSHPVNAAGVELGREVGPPALRAVLSTFPNVSRRHATLFEQPEGWAITDVGSVNGTTVNGLRCSPGVPAPVADGSVVGLGATLVFAIRHGASC